MICAAWLQFGYGAEGQAVVATLGLPADDARFSGARLVTLGRKLFFDQALSASGHVSCATCHQPSVAFSNNMPVAEGVGGATGTRNTPSLLNVAFARNLFWDGRRKTLEEQVLDPFVNPREQGLGNHDALLILVRSRADYRKMFEDAFPGNRRPTTEQIAAALAAYLRSLLSGDSGFDRYFFAGEQEALSAAAKRGFDIFRGRAGCVECHQIGEKSALFTDHDFHSLGVGFERIANRLPTLTAKVIRSDSRDLDRLVIDDPDVAALGRFVITGNPADIGKFRTPSLRNVALTAPYMHDGSVATLEQALEQELYYRALTRGRAILLTVEERTQVIEFLNSLTGVNPLSAGP